MRIFRKATRYFKISREERRVFLKALYLLLVWKIKIAILPMPAYVKLFGQKGNEEDFADRSQDAIIKKIQIAVRRADSVLPWKSKCLTEAIATKRLLEGREIKSTLFLGVAKDEDQKLIAHAWIKWGDRIISGARGHENFTVVQKFS
jgi:hypothetical protein